MALLIANANRSLDRYLELISSAYQRATKVTEELLQLQNVDVVCIADPSMVISEIGIGGYTPTRYLSYLYIDPAFDIDETEIFNTICHELSHAKRYDAMGYGETLLDSMIFEGLATAFEEEIGGKGAFLPAQLLAREKTEVLVGEVKSHFNDTNFDYQQWFILDSTHKLPRWAGYEVGYYLVRTYLARTNKKASELMLEASSRFVS